MEKIHQVEGTGHAAGTLSKACRSLLRRYVPLAKAARKSRRNDTA